MKRSIAIFLGLVLSSHSLLAQAPSGVTITSHRHDRLAITTRDYWIALPHNYDDGGGGKYQMVYISSTDPTTAFVAYQGDTTMLQVVPGKPTTFVAPLSWEMQSSDLIENKAIHVWSNDAPLFVDVNQHDPYTSDATYVIPSIGWGRQYVVASYASLFEGFGTYVYDLPSEFVLISNQDGTLVDIVPSVDLRGDVPSTVVHPKGVPFRVQLNTGQTVQYKAVACTAADSFDVTGTRITSSKPIGVIGATQCANIPTDFPYCDYICEMLQPIRTWGTLYYTAPLIGHVGGDTYLVIGSQQGQTITRTDQTGSDTFKTFTNAYDHFFRHDIATPSSWTSDAPFMLVQYSNSATWPDATNRNYDPFMMDINAVNHFETPVIFNVLASSGNQTPYVWHASIVARSGIPVFVDGIQLKTAPIYDDHQHAIYQMTALALKQYFVTSDSGVSVSVYGQSYDEAVGYAGTIGVSTIESFDSLAPMVAVQSGGGRSTHVDASDPSDNPSGLSHFEVDSMQNMTIVQPPTFIEGNGDATGSFDLVVTDPTKVAHASVRVMDLAGNYTRVEKNYDPATADVSTDPIPVQTTASNSLSTGSTAPNIDYATTQAGRVSIGLFDLLGNRVISVLDADESAGTHSVAPDVRLLPSGVYIYRIEANGTVTSGRLAVAR